MLQIRTSRHAVAQASLGMGAWAWAHRGRQKLLSDIHFFSPLQELTTARGLVRAVLGTLQRLLRRVLGLVEVLACSKIQKRFCQQLVMTFKQLSKQTGLVPQSCRSGQGAGCGSLQGSHPRDAAAQ